MRRLSQEETEADLQGRPLSGVFQAMVTACCSGLVVLGAKLGSYTLDLGNARGAGGAGAAVPRVRSPARRLLTVSGRLA